MENLGNQIIEKLDHFGYGICKIEGKTVFVEGALPGDVVRIKIEKELKNYTLASVYEYVHFSEDRRAFCPYANECGGCQIGNITYQKQLQYKEEKIRELLKKFLKEEIPVLPIISNQDIGYRNKLTLHIQNQAIGLYHKKSNEIVEIECCYLVSEEINEMMKKIRLFIHKVQHRLSKVIIRMSSTKEIMLNFYGEIDNERLLEFFPEVQSISIGNQVLKGGAIKEVLGQYQFLVYPNSFFQVNRFNTIHLYEEIRRLIQPKKYHKILDLYCGTGTIGITLSDLGEEIIGIEVNADAISAANRNKQINNIHHIDFICGNVEDQLDQFTSVDLVIVDPPRSGLDAKTISSLLKLSAADMIYVSCDPVTLMRDLNILKEKYRVVSLTPIDMFPNTYHVEAVVLLSKKKL